MEEDKFSSVKYNVINVKDVLQDLNLNQEETHVIPEHQQ
jgi:hypothetical protein